MLILAMQLKWALLIIGLVIVQWGLAMWALYRLFQSKPGKCRAIVLNILIVTLVIVGPITYLIWNFVKKRRAAAQPVDKAGGDDIK